MPLLALLEGGRHDLARLDCDGHLLPLVIDPAAALASTGVQCTELPSPAVTFSPDFDRSIFDRTLPPRLMRSRKRGARLPEGTVYVGRPTLFCNPFMSERYGHARSVLLHAKWIEASLSDLALERMGYCPAEIEALCRLRARVQRNLYRLAGRALACWCPLTSRWCHADTLLRLANEQMRHVC